VQYGALLGRLTRIVVETVQRTSSDLRLNPHLHMIGLDGPWREEDGVLAWEGLGRPDLPDVRLQVARGGMVRAVDDRGHGTRERSRQR